MVPHSSASPPPPRRPADREAAAASASTSRATPSAADRRGRRFVRRILPTAFLVAAVVALVVGVGELAVLFALMAAFTVLADLWIRIAMSSQRDRDVEEDARERYAREGHWPDEPAPAPDAPRDPHRRARPAAGRRRARR